MASDVPFTTDTAADVRLRASSRISHRHEGWDVAGITASAQRGHNKCDASANEQASLLERRGSEDSSAVAEGDEDGAEFRYSAEEEFAALPWWKRPSVSVHHFAEPRTESQTNIRA
jgi:hypothetical protein